MSRRLAGVVVSALLGGALFLAGDWWRTRAREPLPAPPLPVASELSRQLLRDGLAALAEARYDAARAMFVQGLDVTPSWVPECELMQAALENVEREVADEAELDRAERTIEGAAGIERSASYGDHWLDDAKARLDGMMLWKGRQAERRDALQARLSVVRAEVAEIAKKRREDAAAWDEAQKPFTVALAALQRGDVAGALTLAKKCPPTVGRCKSMREDVLRFVNGYRAREGMSAGQLYELTLAGHWLSDAKGSAGKWYRDIEERYEQARDAACAEKSQGGKGGGPYCRRLVPGADLRQIAADPYFSTALRNRQRR